MSQPRADGKAVSPHVCGGIAQKTLVVTLILVVLLTLTLTLAEVWSGVFGGNGRGIISALSSPTMTKDAAVCANGNRRALVYNKSPKTGSTFIQVTIVKWTEDTNRTYLNCHQTPMFAMVNIRKCLPEIPDPCAVFSSHVFLNSYALNLFSERLPNHWLLTSTRYPPHRLVSFFLFINKLRDDDPNLEPRLTWYVDHLNPWGLYNYHTGEYMEGSCPLTEPEFRRVWSAVSMFDIVIDVNAIRASNAILKHHGLFTLPNVTNLKDRQKERGAARVEISETIRQKLLNKTCVEVELHRAFQIKMARLYEEATGEPCLFNSRLDALDTCIQREEAETLKRTWKLQSWYCGCAVTSMISFCLHFGFLGGIIKRVASIDRCISSIFFRNHVHLYVNKNDWLPYSSSSCSRFCTLLNKYFGEDPLTTLW